VRAIALCLFLALAACAGESPTPGPTETVSVTEEAQPAEPAVATETADSIPTTGTAFGRRPFTGTWAPGDKIGVGTAYTYDQATGDEPAPSRVWFTITDGAITDLLYPAVGRGNVKELSLLVAGPDGVQQELDPAGTLVSAVEYLDPQALAYRVTTSDPGGRWQASKEIVTDPAADSLITRWRFSSQDEALSAYAYFVPRLNGSGERDWLAWRDGEVVAWDENAAIYAVLLADPPPAKASVGYLRSSDGLTDLADGRLDWTFDSLPDANYGAATLALPSNQPVTLVVGFGESEEEARGNAQATLGRGFEAVAQAYIAGWQGYLAGLAAPPAADPLYWVSAMVIKSHEDKTFPGAGVASLSIPWGHCARDEEPREQGYRYIWPRDLYHVAMAFMALGDLESARTTLVYLDDVLQRDDGSFPQNAFLEGQTRWPSLQMDEVADPILLAWFLAAQERYESLVKPAAAFIAGQGPTTPQERWEEIGGYVPHSIAAQVAALVAAADMAERAGEAEQAAEWRARADEWNSQIETWTYTTNGPLGNGQYFLRLTPAGDPNQAQNITIANGGGERPMQEVVDVSTLELVRLGLRPADDPAILESIPEIDAALREETPNGPGWHRYSFDGYGEPEVGECWPGMGRLWPIFNGERGMYSVAAGDLEQAQAMLEAMQRMANEGLMLPEQVFASSGEGTGSATPLAWAHAEYIILARSIEEGRALDRPAVVAERYNAP
jgi:glucoamylase